MVSIDKASFDARGVLILRQWLDVEQYITPMQRELGKLIAYAARACGARYSIPEDPAEFDLGYLALVAAHLDVQPLVYDLAKTLVSFHRLIHNDDLVEAVRTLRATDFVGTGPTASGMRIDAPGDTLRRSPWHQEFPGQFHSLDGVTFWVPLVNVTAEMGPLVVALGSHLDGVAGPLVDATGRAQDDMAVSAYGSLVLPGVESIAERYELCQPESVPGDVMAIDYLTLHRSGANVSSRARWAVQIRYFNFDDAFGARMRWLGGFRTGTTLASANALILEAQEHGYRRASRPS